MNSSRLEDITDKIGSGATPRGGESSYKREGVSLIRSQNILDFHFSKEGLAYIDSDQAKLLNGVTVNENDVLLNITGDSIARSCIVPKNILPARVNQHVAIVRCKEDVNAKYVFYYLQYLKPYLLKICGVGGTRNALTKDIIEDLDIKFNDDHLKISNILGKIDEKIEINNNINVELEKIAQEVYEYWFVQFDFPDKNKRPYKSSGGKMVWNENLKKEIPEGWNAKKFTDWILLDKSGEWGSEICEKDNNLEVVCIRGADINGLKGLEYTTPPVRYISENKKSKILNENDLIIEISGGSPNQSTGRIAFITEESRERFNSPVVCSNFCKAITLKNNKMIYNFYYDWCRLYDHGIFFRFEGKTSGIKNLLFDAFLDSYYAVEPEEKVVNAFYELTRKIQAKKQIALSESHELSILRNWLLPLLMNGQIRIR